MKTACIRISSDILIGKGEDNIFEFFSKNLLLNGITLNSYSVISRVDTLFNLIQSNRDECIIIIGTDSPDINFEIKSLISDILHLKLIKNESVLVNSNKTNQYPNINKEAFLLDTSSILTNPYSTFQGWYLENNKKIIYLPNDLKSIEYIFNNSLVPFFAKANGTFFDHNIIKLFGISENDAKAKISDIITGIDEIKIEFFSDNLELTILLNYSQDLDKTILNSVVSNIYQRLGKYIISDSDVSLQQLALDLLTLSNKTLCIYETVTGGIISSKLNSCKSVAKHLIKSSSIGFSQQNIINEFSLNPSMLSNFGFNSVNVAYEIAGSLLDLSRCDIVLVTLGNLENDRTCYIAVGDNEGIHIYKSNVNDLEKANETLSKSAIYYLIKKLKQNDLYFNKIIV